MNDNLSDWFRELVAETLRNAFLFYIVLIIILVVLSIIFLWLYWKGRENLEYEFSTVLIGRKYLRGYQ